MPSTTSVTGYGMAGPFWCDGANAKLRRRRGSRHLQRSLSNELNGRLGGAAERNAEFPRKGLSPLRGFELFKGNTLTLVPRDAFNPDVIAINDDVQRSASTVIDEESFHKGLPFEN
jgi:hypothetical protein